LKRIIKAENIDLVISDNRPGLYSKNIPSIYITHQLSIKTNSRLGNFFSNKIHHYFIKKYTACWVPDFRENGLAGELSHLTPLPQNVIYIGALSRLEKIQSEKTNENSLVILLSGPEPLRTILEDQLFSQLSQLDRPVLFVRGIPTFTQPLISEQNNVVVKNYLNSQELNNVLNGASLIISRSGYTSIMDYVALQKNALLIATPGQAEQEYLASYLEKKKYFLSLPQQNFDLRKALILEQDFKYDLPAFRMDEYKNVIRELVANLKSGNFAPKV
jgi:predicted glycosyltransferase